jgi:hypothetical protein
MPLITVVAGSGLGTCAAVTAMAMEAGLMLAVLAWLGCGLAGLFAAVRPAL